MKDRANNSTEVLARLLGFALGKVKDYSLPPIIDWKEVIDLSFSQEVAALAIDGLQQLYDLVPDLELELDSEENKGIKREWFGNVVTCELDYSSRKDVTDKLTKMWDSEGIGVTVVKGTAIAKYYPIPEHRFSCDIDLFIGDEWERSCKILEQNGIAVSYEGYKDAEFYVDDVYVESHRYIAPVRGNKTLIRFENYLRGLLAERVERVDGKKYFYPTLMFNVMFFIEHARGHLLHEKMNLKQVCDWVVLRQQDVNWDEFWIKCEEFGFTPFAKMIDRFADIVEGKKSTNNLPLIEFRVWNDMFKPVNDKSSKSFFQQRLKLFSDIIDNSWKFKAFNDVSMPIALARKTWTHFFRKEVKL